MSICPPDCIERHAGNWRAILLALTGVGALFATVSGLYFWVENSYARAADVESLRIESKEMRQEIMAELKDLRREIRDMGKK
jgi:uncharacterized iron-regulated membrane protein